MQIQNSKKLQSKPLVCDGVWSAAPTPFDTHMEIDLQAVERMVEHHIRLGIKGLFLAGSCGEGPWMPDQHKRKLTRSAVAAAAGRIPVALQVTENSAARVLANIDHASEDGADLAIVAHPYFLLNATPDNIQSMYLEIARHSVLPIGIYDLGSRRPLAMPADVLAKILREPNIVLLKDSSGDQARRDVALRAKSDNPNLRLMAGDEFNCVDYIAAGYDGLMLGGAVFHGQLAIQLVDAVKRNDIGKATKLQQRMNEISYAVYGGTGIECWLTGLKTLLVQLGLFSTSRNYLNYPLLPQCETAINDAVRNHDDLFRPSAQTAGLGV